MYKKRAVKLMVKVVHSSFRSSDKMMVIAVFNFKEPKIISCLHTNNFYRFKSDYWRFFFIYLIKT